MVYITRNYLCWKNLCKVCNILLTMFLASSNIFGPITWMSCFVIQKTANAELFSSSTVPTCPISGTRSFMTEDTIQPGAVFSSNWRIWEQLIHEENHSIYIYNQWVIILVSNKKDIGNWKIPVKQLTLILCLKYLKFVKTSATITPHKIQLENSSMT